MDKKWNAALYLRLSRDDDNKNLISESIQNQKMLTEKYAINSGFEIVDFYIDDGYTGTNFDRPNFKRMITDIEDGKINVVITKDQSRLGRDYITTGEYIEYYFPKKEVRFIAINDDLDTFLESSGNEMGPIKAVFNDYYVKDISKKIRSSLKIKKENGIFIGSFAPYGYIKDSQNKGRLIPCPVTSKYVKLIFDLFLGGKTLLGIANHLSSDNVPTPSESKSLAHTQKRFKGIWNAESVKRILTNPTYIGHLTQNRSKKISYKINAKKNIPKEDWIIVKNTHEAIISEDDFNSVQGMLKKRSYERKEKPGKVHNLTGLVFCADCGSSMSFVKESKTRTYLACSTWRRHAKLKLCTSHCIRENKVEDAILNEIKKLADRFIDKNNLIQECEFAEENKINLNAFINDYNKKLSEIKQQILALHKDKSKGIISEEDFSFMYNSIKIEEEKIKERIVLTEEQINKSENANEIKDKLANYLDFKRLDRVMLLELVNKVHIHSDKQITIEFNFDDPSVSNN